MRGERWGLSCRVDWKEVQLQGGMRKGDGDFLGGLAPSGKQGGT